MDRRLDKLEVRYARHSPTSRPDLSALTDADLERIDEFGRRAATAEAPGYDLALLSPKEQFELDQILAKLERAHDREEGAHV